MSNRQKKTCEYLLGEGFDKAVFGDPMSIYYLTGVHIVPYERFYGLVMDAKKNELTMINPSVDSGCMKGGCPEVVYSDEEGPEAALRNSIGVCSKLAVDMKFFTMNTGKLFQKLNCEIDDLGNCIAALRMKKDEEEITQIQMAASIVDQAIAYVFDKIKPGMKEKELQMMLFHYMSGFPGFRMDEFIIYVLGAEKSANPHGVVGDYAFQVGDVVLMDFCANNNHYWSDITRCLFLGEIGNPKLAEIYEIVLQANLAAIAAVRPGIMAKEVDFFARDYITKAGYGEYFIHRTGHGIGLSVHEEPNITSVNELVLEEGMTFTIEPGIYLEGIGGIRIEDDVLVTKDGCRVFTTRSKKLEDNIITL